MMMMRTDNSICSDAAGHTSHGKKRWVGHIGVGGKGAQRGRPSEKGGKVREKKSRRNNQSVGRRRRGRGGGEKKRRKGRKGSLRMMGDQPPGLVRPYGNDVVGHHDQVNSSSFSSSPFVLIFIVLIFVILIFVVLIFPCFDIPCFELRCFDLSYLNLCCFNLCCSNLCCINPHCVTRWPGKYHPLGLCQPHFAETVAWSTFFPSFSFP